jgi:hypothetical protein
MSESAGQSSACNLARRAEGSSGSAEPISLTRSGP